VTVEFYKTFKELMPALLKIFLKTQREETLPIPFYGASIILLSKTV
jgi:hypothetical protein